MAVVGVNGKVKSLEELAEILSALRQAQGRKIVLCHGVFDLLHIGHVRHFERARSMGDVLVVTVTPDRYVNKGPHRPVFNETLRAEAVAALRFVDYVAINQWPMATQAVQLLKPDVYVKGSEYQEASKDRTGGIQMEEEAVKAVGGKIVFTDDITFSSSSLINQNLPVFSKEVSDFLAQFSKKYGAGNVVRYLENARALKVLVVGEAIIDEYQYCEAIGKSSKEPMLAARYLSMEKFAGGALAVANHIASFSDHVGVLTFLGAENSQEEFICQKLNPNIERHFLYRKNSPTIVKRRFIENYFFMKLLELYEMNDRVLETADNEALCAALKSLLPDYDLVMVMDFGHGMLSPQAIGLLTQHSRFLTVNAQSNAGNLGFHTISRYPRADYVCMAENEIRLEARDRWKDLREIVLDVSQKLACPRWVVTRGKNGCLCYGEKEGFSEVPALAGQVVDRMGAGDAFLSLAALCAVQQAPMEVVGFVGNAAGAQAVATVGHRTSLERVPVFKQIESLLK